MAGIGDTNGDARADVIWKSSTGDVVIWLMDGAEIQSAALVATVSQANWQIEALGDFDADGRVDLAWRRTTTGEVALWLLDGMVIKQGAVVTQISDLNWSIVPPQ